MPSQLEQPDRLTIRSNAERNEYSSFFHRTMIGGGLADACSTVAQSELERGRREPSAPAPATLGHRSTFPGLIMHSGSAIGMINKEGLPALGR
jgi:hypothetical protein